MVVYRVVGTDNIHMVIIKAEVPGTVITTGSGGDDLITGSGSEEVSDLEAT